MRIRTQLWAAGSVATVVGAAVILGLLHVTHLSAEATRAQADSQEVARDVNALLALTLEYTLYGGGQRITEQWRARHVKLASTVDTALARNSQPAESLLALHRSVEPLPSLFDRLDGSSTASGDLLAQRRKQFLVERLLTEMQEVAEARYRWAAAIGEDQLRQQRLYTAMVVGAPALMLLLIVVLAVVVGRRVLHPLARLQAAADAVRSGRDEVDLGPPAADELGDMARAFDAMTTALRQEGAARIASERHLRLVIDNVAGLIGYIDADRRYNLVNEAYVQWHGRPLADIVGQPVASFYTAAEFATFEINLQRAFEGEAAHFDIELVHRGEPRALHISFIPRRDEQGRVVGVYTMGSDVTELMRTQRQLRTVMDASPLGIMVRKVGLGCVYVNPAWQRLAGLTLAQSLGDGWLAALHPEEREIVRSRLEAPGDGAASFTAEQRYVRPDGRVLWVRINVAEMREVDQQLGFVATVEDITARRALDGALAVRTNELARSNAELEQFAYVASHDLQEPLRMVTSYTQLLQRRYGEGLDRDALEFIEFIDEGGRRAQALVGDLLSLARVNSQAQPFEPVPMQAVLAEALRGLQIVVSDSSAQVTHDELLPLVMADRRQLHQLLQNLLVNALKFCGQRAPRIHVGSVRDADGRWRISVIDNGIGIGPKFHERVFVMFQRLHLRNEYPGTGIGLAICKKVVERHGGRIGVESVPGQGSNFWFTLADGSVLPSLERS